MRLSIEQAPEHGYLVTDESGVPVGGFTRIDDALVFLRDKFAPGAPAVEVAHIEEQVPTSGWPRLLRGGRQ